MLAAMEGHISLGNMRRLSSTKGQFDAVFGNLKAL